MLFFFFKQKTAYEMRISDWSSDVCSSDLLTTLFHYTCGHELDAEEEKRSLPTISSGARRRPCRAGWPVAVDRCGAAFWHGRALCRDGRGICLWRSHGALVDAGGHSAFAAINRNRLEATQTIQRNPGHQRAKAFRLMGARGGKCTQK